MSGSILFNLKEVLSTLNIRLKQAHSKIQRLMSI